MPRQDPRLQDAVNSVNEEIQDRTISHLLFLLRHQTQQANEIIEFIDRDIIPDLLDKLDVRLARIKERGYDTGPVTTKRIRELLAALNEITRDGLKAAEEKVEANMLALGVSEAQWQAGVIQQAVSPIKIEFVLPAARQIKQAVLNRPFDGMPLSRWFDGLQRSTQQSLERSIRQGLIEGESLEQIRRRIVGTSRAAFMDGDLGRLRRQTEAVVRSAVIHANTQAREETFNENRDLIKGVQWVSTLDTRSCIQCQSLDGKVFPLNEGPRPPRHVACRCTMNVVLKSAQEIGLNLREIPEGTRMSMDGQVPQSVIYNDWLRRQVNAGRMDLVEEALGKTRARLFAAGGLDVHQFTNRRGDTLTLQQLRQRERDAFEAAGVAA